MPSRKILYQDIVFEISYLKVHNQSQKNIFFLHGWGSNKELMKMSFEHYFKDFNHYYIDLPGFGESPNETLLSTQDYAKIIEHFMKSLQTKSALDVIVGHSFGGKVAMLCGNKEVVLLSSAGIITPKRLSIKLKIILAKIAKSLKLKIPALKSQDAKNLSPVMYEIFKNVVNEDFSDIFATSTKKATIFWGKQDDITPLSSGEKIASSIKDSRFFALEGDHYFFIKQGAMIDKLFNQDLQTLHIVVSGKVQDVGYRKFTKAKALELGISGTTQNLDNGNVEIFATGEKACLDRFLHSLHQGPNKAQVSDIAVYNIPIQFFDDFSILQGKG